MNKVKTNMKRGITLIEITFAIIIIAIIAGITIPKILENAAKTEMKVVVSNDAKSIYDSLIDWKSTNLDAKQNGFKNINTTAIKFIIPESMEVNSQNISSAGLKVPGSSSSGVIYKISNINSTKSFVFEIDTSNGRNNLDWSDNYVGNIKEVFKNTFSQLGATVTDGSSTNTKPVLTCKGNTTCVKIEFKY
jgi:type II secretory pathway pseudopilin PulG